MAIVTILIAFRCADYFEDNLYNTGTILHSASAGPGPLLQTSLVTEYFVQYPIERAEDWHRSLSILIASRVVRLTGAPVAITALHLFYLAAFGTLLFRIVRTAALEAPNTRDRANWIALASIAALAFSPAGLLILSRTAMDDPLAGSLALGGLLLSLREEFPTRRAAACAGLCFGATFWAKDFYLLWTGLGSLILLVGLFLGPLRVTFGRLLTALIPGMVAAPIAAGKLLWNHADLGTFLPTLALTENRIYIYGFYTGWNPHFPFYLTGNDNLASAITLAGGLLPAIKAAILVQIPAMQTLIEAFIPVAPLLIAALFVTRRYIAHRPLHGRVSIATAVIFITYIAFFMTGSSTVDQPRYWIVPVGMACGLGLIRGLDLLSDRTRERPALRLGVLGVLYAIGVYQIPAAYAGLRKPPLIAPAMVGWIHQHLAHGNPVDTVALDGRMAFYYYSLTGDRVVTVWPAALGKLTTDQTRRWLTDYHVGWALLAESDIATRNALEKIGFAVEKQDAGWIAMRPHVSP
ncbi:MAG TPA: hypothetical protein DDZ81_06345 [Acetobacteraceae bacterium]|nr:hypothetical protein [Acetobacteraceae bacterium]